MRLLIHDASVLIDLLSVDLLDTALTLPFIMETTDLVRREILRAGYKEILGRAIAARQLEIIHSSEEDLRAIAGTQTQVTGLSLADCSVLFHAGAKGAAILSGDALLRRTAEERSITVHGTLWILSELTEQELLSHTGAIDSLKRLMNCNRRLPRHECKKLLDSWRRRSKSPL